MDLKIVPATNEEFYNLVTHLRNQIMWNITEKGKNASPQVIEDTLDTLLPVPTLKGFDSWSLQKPKLEEALFDKWLNTIVAETMESKRKNGDMYKLSLAVGGRCLLDHTRDLKNPFGFKEGREIANPHQYTFDELKVGWRDIFEIDAKIENNEILRDKYAPLCKHELAYVPATVLSTRHRLMLVNEKGDYVIGTSIAYCRTKSGPAYLFKFADLLTGNEESIDDYLGARTRHPNKEQMWIDAINIIMQDSDRIGQDLSNMLILKGYKPKDVNELRKFLESNPDVGGFFRGRSDLEFKVENLPKGKEDKKFGEVFLPCYADNKISWQIFHFKDYRDIEGDEKTTHSMYKTDREREILEGYTPWHWSIIRRLAPFFVDDYLKENFDKVYASYLSLSYLKQ